MRLAHVLLPLASFICAGSAVAASSSYGGNDGFIALGGGLHYPNAEVRNLMDSNTGLHLNLGLGAYGQAMIGFPTFEFDWGHITGKGNRLDTGNVTYCERIRLQEGVYVGAGLGTAWNRLVRSVDVGGDGNDISNFRPCVRGMVGVTLSRQFYVEAAAFYNGKIDGTDANALALLAGIRF